jgi:hypothetical protein
MAGRKWDYENYKLFEISVDKEFKDHMDTIPHPRQRWHYTYIIEALKKDNSNKLWDKPMPNFTFRDYEVLKNLV